MDLPSIIAFSSAAFSTIYIFVAPFSKRKTLPRWSFSVGMLLLAIEQTLIGLELIGSEFVSTETNIFLRFAIISLLPSCWLTFAVSFSRGTRRSTQKERSLLLACSLVVPVALLLLARDQLIIPDFDIQYGGENRFQLGWSGFLLQLMMMGSMIGALVSLERTYRASLGTLRWKIKFMLYGIGVLFAARFFTSSQIILTQHFDISLEIINSVALLAANALVARSVSRPGSFEIDLYPSRSIISGSLVISLCGAYLVFVGVFSKIVAKFGGEQAFAAKTLVIFGSLVALGITIQSDRFRQLIRRFVSRNFQRPLYDYRSLWLKVAQTTSNSVRVDEICSSTTKLLAHLLDTKLVNIWTLEPSSSQFQLSASSIESMAASIEAVTIDRGLSDSISQDIVKNPNPLDLTVSSAAWAKAVLTRNPSSFDDGGNHIFVPMVGNNTPVGFMVLGDRTNTLRFTQQEFDTLRCIADHIAGALLSAALTRKLEQNKEIEAFQTIATFFVHDLKNAVSTLNLMLKNMPLHWDNPEFREDALRGIGNTSNRISDLITRLSQVRHELDIQQRPINLKEVIDAAVQDWSPPSGIRFTMDCPEGLVILGDFSKLKSVVLNLFMNASEAMDWDGEIELRAEQKGSLIHLIVQDNGPGMSRDFIANSLFRPFKTTKKSGLGIGMFQSKMIIEGHKGSISVDSQEGKGARFALVFPKAKAETISEKENS